MVNTINAIKKARKKKKSLVLLNETPSEEDAFSTVEQIQKDLVNIFRRHVGEENCITPLELFVSIYEVSPSEVDIFRRIYMWNVIKNVLRLLRNEEKLFVINKGTKLFVLKTSSEKEEFKKQIDRTIESLNNVKKKADSWIAKKKYLKI